MQTLLSSIAKVLLIPMIAVLGAAGYHFQSAPAQDYSLDIAHLEQRVQASEQRIIGVETEQSQNLGQTNALPTSVALFTTSLQSAITSAATSMTLVSATYNNGASTLASSSYDFILDEGTASQEFISADCTATTCTNLTRGLDFMTGTTSVTSLKFAHRRGASVKITDAPILLKLTAMANGSGTYPVPIFYASSVATSTLAADRSSIASAGLVADTAFAGAGVINATVSAKGVVQLATTLQGASSTASCSSGASCVLPASSATSTYNSATAPLRVVVTQNNGKIDPNFLTLTGAIPGFTATGANSNSTSTFATSSLYVGAFPAYNIGKNIQVFSSTGTSTFTVPSGISVVYVRLVGGGGSGGVSGSATVQGGGGAAGGYSEGPVNVSATSSIQVFVGSGGSVSSGTGAVGTWSTFGTNGFYMIGNGGGGGTNTGVGGTGGTASGGSVNIVGGTGSYGPTVSACTGAIGAAGGASPFGGGAFTTANAAGPYGAGSMGLCNTTNTAANQGIVIVTW